MPSAPASTPPGSARPGSPRPGAFRSAWIASFLAHGILVIAVLAWALLKPEPPPATAVFELVSLERPKLRPLAPKTPEPPPPPEKKIETRAPEAPKLTDKPRAPVAPSKPEPKVARPPAPDTTLPIREVPRENSNPSPVQVTNAPVNPQLAFWAGRVKRIIEARWNPPSGIDVEGSAKTVVSFRVSVEDGTLSAVEITQSSGNKLLDDEATRALKRLERLPKPLVPAAFSEDFLQVSYEFIYQGL